MHLRMHINKDTLEGAFEVATKVVLEDQIEDSLELYLYRTCWSTH